jgi:hypothetical protein
MKYFSYNDDDGMTFHANADEARLFAQYCIDEYSKTAHDGWDEGVDSVCWGVVSENATVVTTRQRTDADTFISSDCDTVVEYGLMPT